MKQKSWISLLLFVLLCLFLGFVGSVWTRETVTTWYPALIKPSWTPPNWVFGPVWTLLYLMIAMSGWLIYQAENSQNRSIALGFYTIQLFLNFIWPLLFFSLQNPLWGLIDILLLCLFISLTILKAWEVRPIAAVLLIPYLFWVVYAASLNAGVWLLN